MVKGNTPEWADSAQVDSQLPELVKAAHAKDVKVLISVGGWSGCLSFRYSTDRFIFDQLAQYVNLLYIICSTMAADASSRKEFIQWSLDAIDK